MYFASRDTLFEACRFLGRLHERKQGIIHRVFSGKCFRFSRREGARPPDETFDDQVSPRPFPVGCKRSLASSSLIGTLLCETFRGLLLRRVH